MPEDKTGVLSPEDLPPDLQSGSHDLSVFPIIKFAAKTDMGKVRENNEDKFEFFEPAPALLGLRGRLYAVSDGMGGAAAGQIASEQTLNMLVEAYFNYYNTNQPGGKAIDVETALKSAVLVSNGVVRNYAGQRPEWKGMGATLTGVVFVGNRAYVSQVGDSRAYLIRDERIRQVTLDHSWVEEQVRSGLMTREAAEASPYRNIITRSIGTQATVEPDIYVELTKKEDIWVLCSDGLTTYLEGEEIKRIVLAKSLADAVWHLISIAKERGGRDNITVMILKVSELAPLASIL